MTFLTRRRIPFLSTIRWIASVAFSLYIGSVPSACLKQYHWEKKKKGVDVWWGGKKKKKTDKKPPVISTFPPPPSSTSVAQSEVELFPKSTSATPTTCGYRVGAHTELNLPLRPPAPLPAFHPPQTDRYMWGVCLHAACIRVPVGGVECLRQASSSSDPLPTGMGEAASSWDFTLLLSVWLQMLPLPPPAAFQRARRTAMIDGEQIWETRGSREKGDSGKGWTGEWVLGLTWRY